MKLPIREFSAAIRPHLEAVGLDKRAGDVYTIEAGNDFLGVVALGRATEHGVLGIWPIVGVRHQPTEALLAELAGDKPHPYLPATIQSGLGYLMPEQRWIEWLIEYAAMAELRAREVAGAVRDYGLPAIRSNASLAAVLQALRSRQPMTSARSAHLLPVVLAELGHVEDATIEIARQVETRRERTGPEADKYRAFAGAFAHWLDGSGRE